MKNEAPNPPGMKPADIHSADEVMCHCSGTTRGEIQNLFAQGLGVDAISRRTGALTGCGGCEWDVALYLQECADHQRKT